MWFIMHMASVYSLIALYCMEMNKMQSINLLHEGSDVPFLKNQLLNKKDDI